MFILMRADVLPFLVKKGRMKKYGEYKKNIIKKEMKTISRKLQRPKMIILLTLLLAASGCEDVFDIQSELSPDEKTVEVSFSIGFESATDGASSGPLTKNISPQAGIRQAFDMQLIPGTTTKTTTGQPDNLYNLEVCQYDSNGNFKTYHNLGTLAPGTTITLNLSELPNCQLFFVARGQTSAVPSINGKSIAALNEVVATATEINQLADMNAMPYILYLRDVHITGGKIQNPQGKDVRVRLKRLAVRLTLDWSLSAELTGKGYTLKEVRLLQVPARYSLFPTREETQAWGTVYPGSATEFIDGFRLTDTGLSAANGTYATWMPANAQGRSAAVTDPLYRTKEQVNPATSYLEFVVDHTSSNKRLYYRAYLGGNTTSDFNLLENTDYHWSIRIGTDNYVNDRRIQLLDLNPVKSTNLVPTANCFMLLPGTNICFNPYRHTSGTNGWNDALTDGNTLGTDKTITDVKVVWQTKDAGTSGELVVGYVADLADNHQNLVHLTGGESLSDALISVKVPVTKGGNALLAAYNSAGQIVWSWHLWISDYVPQRITSSLSFEQAQQQTKGGSVHRYANAAFASGIYQTKVIMDRNLCATAGGFPGTDASNLDYGRRIGYLYQWGRKDPFFGSVDGTNNEINVIYDGDGTATQLKKVSYSSALPADENTLLWSIRNPMSFIMGNASWYNGSESTDGYRKLYENGGKKSLYDPCPDGWTVPDKIAFDGYTMNNAYWYNSDGTFTAKGKGNHTKGGRLYNLSGSAGVPVPQTIHNTAWYPTTAFRSYSNGVLAASQNGYQGTRTLGLAGSAYRYYYVRLGINEWTMTNGGGQIAEPVPYRCVQE